MNNEVRYRELKNCPECGSNALREEKEHFLCTDCYTTYMKPNYVENYDRNDFSEYYDSRTEADASKVARAFNELIERVRYLEKKLGI